MPAKHPFRASLGDVARKKLDKIIEYEEGKAGLDTEGNQIKLTPKEIIEEMINVRHELIEGGVTNRQRLGGIEAAVSEAADAIKVMSGKLENLITVIMEERNHVHTPND